MKAKTDAKKLLGHIVALIVLVALSACGEKSSKGTPPINGDGYGGAVNPIAPNCANCPTNLYKRAYAIVNGPQGPIAQLGLDLFTDQAGNIAATGRIQITGNLATCGGLAPGIYPVAAIAPGNFEAFGDKIYGMRLSINNTPFGIELGYSSSNAAHIIEVSPTNNNTAMLFDGPYNYNLISLQGDSTITVNHQNCLSIGLIQ